MPFVLILILDGFVSDTMGARKERYRNCTDTTKKQPYKVQKLHYRRP